MPKIFSMPKVRVSKDTTNVGVHDLSHDVSSTFEFGFCAPQFSKLMMPDSDMDIDVSASIRLMPMPLPTFGRVSMKYYHEFVPMEDLWRPTNQFFAQQYFNPSQGSTGNAEVSGYIPSKVPYLTMYNFETNPGTNQVGAPSLLSLVLGGNNAVWSAFKITSGSINLNNHQDLKVETNSLTEAQVSTTVVNRALNIYQNKLSATGSNGAPCLGLSPYTRDTNQQLFYDMNMGSITLESCDMYFVISGKTSTTGTDTLTASAAVGTDYPILVCIKFTNNGRRVRKILEGLGIRLDPSYDQPINALPIFAYYKAWYDLMQPSRLVDWEGTAAYRLLDSYTQFGDWNILKKDASASSNSAALVKDFAYFFQYDLPGCFATCEPNYVSMQLPSMSTEQNQLSLTYQDSDSHTDNIGQLEQATINSNPLEQATGTISTADGITLIQRLTRYITKNSIIGKRIAEFMKVHYNADVDDKTSNFVGKQEVSAQIGDVYATAETADKDLGQFAGQGYGSTDEVPHFHFHSNVHGYYIVFAAVEPISNYVQSFEGENLDVTHFDFATPEFDAIGYEVTPKAEVYANTDFGLGTRCGGVKPYESSKVLPSDLKSSAGFGFAPRYSAQKVMKSKLLGDLSLKSTRDSYLGYTLDNWISTSLMTSKKSATAGNTDYEIANVPPSYFIAGTIWRYLGRNGFLNNYNRIFYNTGKETATEANRVFDIIDDNFVVHSAWNVRYKCPLKSLSNSFDTLGDSNETLSLTKA